MAQGPVKWPVALAQGPGTPPGRVLGAPGPGAGRAQDPYLDPSGTPFLGV